MNACILRSEFSFRLVAWLFEPDVYFGFNQGAGGLLIVLNPLGYGVCSTFVSPGPLAIAKGSWEGGGEVGYHPRKGVRDPSTHSVS